MFWALSPHGGSAWFAIMGGVRRCVGLVLGPGLTLLGAIRLPETA